MLVAQRGSTKSNIPYFRDRDETVYVLMLDNFCHALNDGWALRSAVVVCSMFRATSDCLLFLSRLETSRSAI